MWVFNDLLRRYWKWILAIIISLFILIISVRLFIIIAIIVVIAYVVFRFRGNRNKEQNSVINQRVRLGIVREITKESNIHERKLCLNVGLGKSIAMIGDRWVVMLSLDYVDTAIINDLVNLGDLIMGNGKHYLLIHGHDINDVMIRSNTAIQLLSSKGLTFRQLDPSEVINEVVGVWMN